MNDVVLSTAPSLDHPLLRRRSSIATSTTLNLLLHRHSASTATTSSSSSSFPPDDLELLSIRPASYSYTSLKDLIPSAAVNSPKPNSAALAQPGSDICIRNRLVKQAAWAYLQPMSTSSDYADGSFFHQMWPRIAAFFDFVRRNVIRAIEWTLRFIRIRISR